MITENGMSNLDTVHEDGEVCTISALIIWMNTCII